MKFDFHCLLIFSGDPIINLQSREDMLMLSDQLKSVLTNMDDYCDSYETLKRVNLWKKLEEQHRKLKTKLQMAEAAKGNLRFSSLINIEKQCRSIFYETSQVQYFMIF